MSSIWLNHIPVKPVHILNPCSFMTNMNILFPSRLGLPCDLTPWSFQIKMSPWWEHIKHYKGTRLIKWNVYMIMKNTDQLITWHRMASLHCISNTVGVTDVQVTRITLADGDVHFLYVSTVYYNASNGLTSVLLTIKTKFLENLQVYFFKLQDIVELFQPTNKLFGIK